MGEATARASNGLMLFNTDWLSSSFSQDEQLQQRVGCGGGVGRISNRLNKDDGEDDDNQSVSSTGSGAYYYDRQDLNPTDWIKAMDAKSLGIAVVALTTAVTHPVLFLAGALTAFGTASAANSAHDYFWGDGICRLNNPLAWLFPSSAWGTAADGIGADADPAEVGDAVVANSNPAPDACSSTTGSTSTRQTQEGSGIRNAGDDAEGSTESDSARLHKHDTMIEFRVDDQSPDSNTDSWLHVHYPKLEHPLVDGEKFVRLSVVEFFHIFLDNDAPYNFKEFQKKRGDIDIDYGRWRDLPVDDKENCPSSLLSTPAANVGQAAAFLQNAHSYKERVISFKAKTNSFFGPPYATTTKTQRILMLSKRLAVLESKTILGDIPFCERFYVVERWIIQADKNEDDGIYTSCLSSSCEVVFTKQCPFEFQIRTKSCAALTDVGIAWCAMAQEALKLAEKAKINRLSQRSSSFQKSKHSSNDEQKCEGRPVIEETQIELRLKQRPMGKPGDGMFLLDESIEVEHEEYAANFGGALSMRRSDSEPELRRLVGGFHGRVRRSLSQLGYKARSRTSKTHTNRQRSATTYA